MAQGFDHFAHKKQYLKTSLGNQDITELRIGTRQVFNGSNGEDRQIIQIYDVISQTSREISSRVPGKTEEDVAKIIMSLAESLSKDLIRSDGSQWGLNIITASDFRSILNLAISHLKLVIEGKSSEDEKRLLDSCNHGQQGTYRKMLNDIRELIIECEKVNQSEGKRFSNALKLAYHFKKHGAGIASAFNCNKLTPKWYLG